MNKLWFNYLINNDKNKTYIGSTNNINRRIRQHNGEIKGGAKYTRGCKWYYYCIIYTININKNIYLSREWYLKYIKRKNKYYGITSKKKIIEFYFSKKNKIVKHKIKYKKYNNIIFISNKYNNLIPLLYSNHIIIILDVISSEIILSFLHTISFLSKL
jgi:predicted GIY-YIG superfamily endonuclease